MIKIEQNNQKEERKCQREKSELTGIVDTKTKTGYNPEGRIQLRKIEKRTPRTPDYKGQITLNNNRILYVSMWETYR